MKVKLNIKNGVMASNIIKQICELNNEDCENCMFCVEDGEDEKGEKVYVCRISDTSPNNWKILHKGNKALG